LSKYTFYNNDVDAKDIAGNEERVHHRCVHGEEKQTSIPQECYQITVKGHLDDRWASWFEGMTITRADNGETRLTGPVVDQAALHGLLRKVRDVGLPLLSVTRIIPSQTTA